MGVIMRRRAVLFPWNADLSIGALPVAKTILPRKTTSVPGPGAGGAIVISPACSEAECRETVSRNAQSAGRLRPQSSVAPTIVSVLFSFAVRICAVLACVLMLSLGARAQEAVANLDPATTQVTFTLAATLHTVHGAFKLKSGQIHFDPATGKAGGAIILDATSANTDNDSRDKKMHAEILESAKFPEITFTPTQVTGPLADLLAGKGIAQFQVAGVFRLHGQDHPMTISVSVAPVAGAAPSSQGGQFQASTQFDIPYEKWGLKNPSTFVLHVSDTVNLEIHSTVQLSRTNATR